MFNLNNNEVIGKKLGDIVGDKYRKLIVNDTAKIGEIIDIRKEKYTFNSVPIIVDDESIGTVITFQNITYLQNLEKNIRVKLLERGFIAKYNFDNIVHKSNQIENCIENAKKYSKYDSPILIADKTTFEFNPIGVSVEGICLYSSDGATGISNTLESETALIAKALASNTGTDYANLALFLALYDNNNKLIGLSMSQPTIINQNAKDVLLTANLELTEEQKQSTTKVKVLVWDINTMYGYKNYYEQNIALE